MLRNNVPNIQVQQKNYHTYVPKDEHHNSSRLLIKNNACQLTVEQKIQSTKRIKLNRNTLSLDFYTQWKYFLELKTR